jgi:hypothetical protein
LEIRDVLAHLSLQDRELRSEGYFLLAGALFGQDLMGLKEVSDSLIRENLVKGFLITPVRDSGWHFEDVREFMNLVWAARLRADSLLKCYYIRINPTLEHARGVITDYSLFGCAIMEVEGVIKTADTANKSLIAGAYFLLGQARYGQNLVGVAPVADSVVLHDLAFGYWHDPEWQEDWLFADRADFMNLLERAREKSKEFEKKRRGGMLKWVLGVAGIGAVAGILAAVLSGGDGDDGQPPPTSDTIPWFPPPPPN